jgi:hypothetical protein
MTDQGNSIKQVAHKVLYKSRRIIKSRLFPGIQRKIEAARREKDRRRVNMGPYHIFCSYGGSGSSFLIEELGAFPRPDVLWQPDFQGRALVEWEHFEHSRNLLGGRGYETTGVNWDQFHARTDYKFQDHIDPQKSIKENMLRFFRWIEATEYKVFCAHLSIMHFFSDNDVRNTTFLVRHPLHAYGSFCKEERHKKEIDALGGIESTRAIDFWAERWNRVAQDYLKSVEKGLSPVLIRFEFASQDCLASEYHQHVLKHFDGTKRNSHFLSDKSAEYLKSLVEEAFFRIYPEWDV